MNIIDMVFGCWHKHLSFPRTDKSGQRRSSTARAGTYVVCLDCGQEFAYDWQQMRILSVREQRVRDRARLEVQSAPRA